MRVAKIVEGSYARDEMNLVLISSNPSRRGTSTRWHPPTSSSHPSRRLWSRRDEGNQPENKKEHSILKVRLDFKVGQPTVSGRLLGSDVPRSRPTISMRSRFCFLVENGSFCMHFLLVPGIVAACGTDGMLRGEIPSSRLCVVNSVLSYMFTNHSRKNKLLIKKRYHF